MQKTSHLIYLTPPVYSFPTFALEVCQTVYTEFYTLQVRDCFSFFFKTQSKRGNIFPLHTNFSQRAETKLFLT